MRFENAFDVQAPVEEVWSTLLDVERVAPCMPGAEVLERTGEDSYRVAIKVRVGPIAMTYRGDVQIAERDDATHTATMRAKAREARGQGTADAHVQMSLAPLPDGTHATLETEVALSGRVAAMGQGVIADVSAKLVETFAANLAAMLAPDGAAAAPAPRQSGGGRERRDRWRGLAAPITPRRLRRSRPQRARRAVAQSDAADRPDRRRRDRRAAREPAHAGDRRARLRDRVRGDRLPRRPNRLSRPERGGRTVASRVARRRGG